MKNVIFLILLMITFGGKNSYSQDYTLTNSFTMADGLPSNHVYDICEDKDGFLWIATDNGVSRFDGKRFINYSTRDGLPSSDAIGIQVTLSGLIWVNCFKQAPSYFDVDKNRFVCVEEAEIVRKISTDLVYCFIPKNGNIVYQSRVGFVELDKNKIVRSGVNLGNGSYFASELGGVRLVKQVLDKGKKNRFYFRNGRGQKIGGFDYSEFNDNWGVLDAGYACLTDLNKLTCLKATSFNPFSFEIKEHTFLENIDNFKLKGNTLNVIGRNNTLFICDRNTLEILHEVELAEKTNSAFQDKDKRIWVATVNSGLLFYSTSKVTKLLSQGQVGNVLKILKTSKDGIYGGGYNGKVFHWKNNLLETVDLSEGKFDQRVIRITEQRNGIYVFTSTGYHFNFGKEQYFKYLNGFWPIKCAASLNGGAVVIGVRGGVVAYSSNSNKFQLLNTPNERVSEVVRLDNDKFYYIGHKGVFLYSFVKTNYEPVLLNESILRNKATKLCVDESQNLWVGSSRGKIYFLEKGKFDKNTCKEVTVNDNITALFAKDKRLWISTKSGLFVLDYSTGKKWKLNKLTEADGLNSDNVNDFSFYNDSLFLATSAGVAVVPYHFKFSKFDIKPKVISVTLNGENIGVKNQFSLKEKDKSVIVQLAGVDLTGHFSKFKYAVNDKINWSELEGNFLNISLRNGQNEVYVKAIDASGNVSSQILRLTFNVAYPFYYRIWFWVAAGIVLTILVLGYFSRKKIQKQKLDFERRLELEAQRKAITADLHDDIGATLSSLQINSAVANQLMEKNPKEAHKVLNKIEDQSQGLADKIGDIIWSMKPGEQEFMNLSSRIKNFANDILGVTEIGYKVEIDPVLDKGLTDFTLRKNLMLIAKEGINNTAKYSKASKVEVKIRIVEEHIYFSIKDDGIGFVSETSIGNGIQNMKNRVEELKGDFSLISEKNVGTTILIEIPCPYILGQNQ